MRTGHIFAQAVADVKQTLGGNGEPRGGVLEDRSVRLVRTMGCGNDDFVEVSGEAKFLEEGDEAIVPIGDDGELQAERFEFLQRGNDVIENQPGIGLGETIVDGIEKFGRDIGDPEEGVANHVVPFGARIFEFGACGPCVGKLGVEASGAAVDTELARDGCIDLAY